MIHELKIWPQYYCRVADGSKTFEVRENDRGYQVGDTVILKEFDPTPVNPTSQVQKGFTGAPALEFKIGYIYVIDFNQQTRNEIVVFSLLPLPKQTAKKKVKKSKT